ncbi:glycosyltransferase family 2 protein [Ammonicoccus fulvus]|uniref:Glycosyltransferase family 2 protein n=1 Tax=Ammonicoccus fulvus TaxID=3138240 RepID=A0ABZ3FR10_9ACTN
MDPLTWVLTLRLFVLTAIRILLIPLALVFEWRARRRTRVGDLGLLPRAGEPAPLVSIVVPAYNEEKVISGCLGSILGCGYPNLEVIVVDDGSRDRTLPYLARLVRHQPRVTLVSQANAGKGAALNNGIGRARGEIIMLVDADGQFGPTTIPEMLRAFDDDRVGAVCGSDRPLNLDRLQTRFLAVISHVGTGLVRRALHVLGCMPVVSGNVGAFRASALRAVAVPGMGPLRTDTLGEDLELTWRMHRAGFRVAFAPHAVVHAESPSTLHGLWKQRVRWARGLLQSLAMHHDMIGRPRYRTFGFWLAYTVVAMVWLPVLQVAGALALPFAWWFGGWRPPAGLLEVVIGAGLGLGLVFVLVAIALDRTPADLNHAWTLPAWPAYSLLMSATLLKALWLEAKGSPHTWNKLDRTGVVSVAIPTARSARPALARQRVLP